MSAVEESESEVEQESAALLERAIGYALCGLRPVTDALLSRPTPCRGWSLEMLLQHANESLAALHEGLVSGQVAPVSVPRSARGPCARPGAASSGAAAGGSPWGDPHSCPDGSAYGDPAERFRSRATSLLGAWSAAPATGRAHVTVDGWPLPTALLARTGALEIAVHGWDIAQAVGLPRPIPPRLATDLLRAARELVPEPGARHPLFAPPVRVGPEADPSDRLVAFLGRDPGAPNGTGDPGAPNGTGGTGRQPS